MMATMEPPVWLPGIFYVVPQLLLFERCSKDAAGNDDESGQKVHLDESVEDVAFRRAEMVCAMNAISDET